jgi:phage-related holin
MKELILLKRYLFKIFISSKMLFNTSKGLIVLIPSISISMLTNLQISLIVLLIAYILDFGTGILAAWVQWKEIPIEKRNSNLIQSKLMRKSIIKAIGYMIFILLVFGLNLIFFRKSINIDSISDVGFSVTELAIGFCIAIEGYSAVFENLKKAGFDLKAKFNKLISWIKGIKVKINDLFNSEKI